MDKRTLVCFFEKYEISLVFYKKCVLVVSASLYKTAEAAENVDALCLACSFSLSPGFLCVLCVLCGKKIFIKKTFRQVIMHLLAPDTSELTEQKIITTEGTEDAKALCRSVAFLCFLVFSVFSAVKNAYKR